MILYGRQYTEITYDNGEKILKRYNEKTKMWVELEFKKSDDAEDIKKIKQVVKNALLNTVHS